MNLGCGSTGMPRPLSVTDRNPSASTLHLDPVGVARPPPRPWRCRSPRRTGGAAPSRRCRRRTCRAGAGPARGLPAPRCRRPCSSPASAACGSATFVTGCCMSSTVSTSSTVSGSTSSLRPAAASWGPGRRLPGRRHGLGRGLAGDARRLLQHLELRPRLLGLAALGLVGSAEQVARGAQTESCHGLLARCWRNLKLVLNATHAGVRACQPSSPVANPPADGTGRLTSARRSPALATDRRARVWPLAAFLLGNPPYVAAMTATETIAAGAEGAGDGPAFGAPSSPRPCGWPRPWR